MLDLIRPRTFIALAALLTLVLCPTATRAQSASSVALQGVVIDPSGRAAAMASIEVTGEAMREPRAATADQAGRFTVQGLPPGKYSIAVRVPGFDTVLRSVTLATATSETISIKLSLANIRESVTVFEALPDAAVAAPSQGSLTARSAQSLISNEFIRNYTSPFSDYSQVIQMAPGAFSVGVNGPGLGDTKTFFRGFKDGYYSMTYDGIPFNDTNDPTHHSWVFFPAQTIGSTVFERSPGSAATIGPSTFGGSVNLLSRSLPQDPLISTTLSYGSFNTRLLDLQFDSGLMGKARLLVEGHEMKSDGYQTYNYQQRKAFSAKLEYAASESTVLTAFSSVMQLNSNTPNQKGSTRALVAAERRQLPELGRSQLTPVLQVQLLRRAHELRVRRHQVGPGPRLVHRQQGLHHGVPQPAELQQHDHDQRHERHRQAEQLLEGRATFFPWRTSRTVGSSASACGRNTHRPTVTRRPPIRVPG